MLSARKLAAPADVGEEPAGRLGQRNGWDAALSICPDAPDEARTMRFGLQGEIAELFDAAGFDDVAESTLDVHSTYASFDELWSGFLAGIGPAGAFCVSLSDEQRVAVRGDLFNRLGSPDGPFLLAATARYAVARVPGD